VEKFRRIIVIRLCLVVVAVVEDQLSSTRFYCIILCAFSKVKTPQSDE
jgi:hypothetical protein